MLEKALASIEDNALIAMTPEVDRPAQEAARRDRLARGKNRKLGTAVVYRIGVPPGSQADHPRHIARTNSNQKKRITGAWHRAARGHLRAGTVAQAKHGARSAVPGNAIFSSSNGIFRHLWPVIHTVNPSLTIGLEGHRVLLLLF
jgi:hypothetical protein